MKVDSLPAPVPPQAPATAARPATPLPEPIAAPRENRSADRMLFTFVGFLQTRLGLLRASADNVGTARLDVLERQIEKLRAAPRPNGWDEAYQLEREIVLLQSGEPLHQCLKELLDEADAQVVPTRARLRAMYADALTRIYDKATPPVLAQGSDVLLRQVTNNVLEAIQWEARRKYLAIPQRKQATHRVLWAGLVGSGLFLGPLALASCTTLLKIVDSRLTWGDDILGWRGMVLWTVLTAGLLGAVFSRLQYMQSGADSLSLEELENAKAWRWILLRIAVGMIGALLVFYFLTSELFKGSLVPSAADGALTLKAANATGDAGAKSSVLVPNAPLALLVVWCFLAGFSERLVPNILSAAEGQLASAYSKKDTKGS